MLKHLTWLAARYPNPTIQEKLTYLQKREAHMQYPTYQAAGWPIGSGSVESANKLVVEARLKGAGMRWGRHNVNSMLVLARDLDDSGSSATRAAHASAAGKEPPAADQRLLDPRLLGSTAVSAVSPTCSRCHLTDG